MSCQARLHRGLCLILGAASLPLLVSSQTDLRLTYFGTAGWEITDGKAVILVDPYFTRPKMRTSNDDVSQDDPRPPVTANSIVAPATDIIDAHIGPADVMLVNHTHADHALDMPYIAPKTGAMVIGQPLVDGTSRISREAYVRICERLEVKFLGATRRRETGHGLDVSVAPSLDSTIFGTSANGGLRWLENADADSPAAAGRGVLTLD